MANLLALQNIQRSYESGAETVYAIRDISLTIEEGAFVAIMGRSGSGKSTLMHILGLLDLPSSGSYTLRGEPISEYKGAKLARTRNKNFGFVFQSFNLLPRTTVYRNVELPLIYNHSYDRKPLELITEVLDEVGLAHRVNHRSNQLSGGEQQRVAIARAIVNNPAVILADEPTGNLDSKNTAQIMDVFTKLHKKGKTIILVTHEPDIAEHAQRVITLQDGAIIKDEKRA